MYEIAADIASRQHGIVTRRQLLDAGVHRNVVSRAVQGRRLKVLHRGVYRVGPIGAPLHREMAAVLACGGGGALISHRSAGALRDLCARGDADAPIDVTVERLDRGRRPGIRRWRTERLAADEITEIEGVPLTSPLRTLLDLAMVLSPAEIERAVAAAERRELVSVAELAALAHQHRRRRGTGMLMALCNGVRSVAYTRSEAEARLLELVRRVGLPPPAVNARVRGHEVDFHWSAQRLVVEVDGFAFHSSPRSFERDRSRDAALAAAGLRVMRITWKQLSDHPERTIVRIAQALVRS